MAGEARGSASLPLQVVVYFHYWFAGFFFLLTLALLVYKGYDLPYPASVYGMEVSLCFFFAVVEAVRLFSLSLGNRTEQTSPLLFGVVMSALGILCHVYYMRLQTYVYGLARLKVEVTLNSVAVAFVGVEVLLGLVTAVAFMSASKY